MKDNIRAIVLISMVLLMIAAFCSLINNSYMLTVILSFIIAAIAAGCLIMHFASPKSDVDLYYDFLKKIKKAFLSIIVSSEKIPDIKGKTIVYVSTIDDLVDISEKVRKPIYYIEGDYTCDFILLHENEANVYILKANDELTSKFEEYIKEQEELEKNIKNSKILEDIYKTTIIEIPDGSLYKVSPIKNKEKREEKKKNVLDSLQLPKMKQMQIPKLKRK